MKLSTKKILIFLGGLSLIGCYCEFIIYYIVIAQCGWPILNGINSENILKAFILADPHLLGPYKGHWLDKWRREWQMHQAFQAIVKIHSPDVVFILGDLFDEGEWTSDRQFIYYVERFNNLFSLPKHIKMYVVAGNHDIGFHNRIRRGSAERFTQLLNSPSVQHIILKDNHFVLINSMAMEGDSCNLCTNTRRKIDKVAGNINIFSYICYVLLAIENEEILKFPLRHVDLKKSRPISYTERLMKCTLSSDECYRNTVKVNYSQPIIMQHFPLYRKSDLVCTESDAAPYPERKKLFRPKIDSLSQEATEYLIKQIKPRAVFGGHTHHGCLIQHSFEQLNGIEFEEYSVPSFSWRNRPDPKYLLVSISSNMYGVQKCALPREVTMALTAIIMTIMLLTYFMRKRTIGRGYLQ